MNNISNFFLSSYLLSLIFKVFSGYIDFDLSQRNIRIFDIAYFLLGLLSDKEYNTLSEDSWLIIVQETLR